MKKINVYLGLLLVVLATVANLIYWGTRKQGYHLDENYTYGYCTEFESAAIVKSEKDGPFFNNWHDSGFFLDYYSISDEEAFNYKAALGKMKISCHPPLFYLMFFTLVSITRNYSKWIGIVINIVAAVVTVLGIYGISKKMTKDKKLLSIGISALVGLSACTASGVVFIRMYAWLTAMTVLFVYTQLHVWEKLENLANDKKRIRWYLLLYSITLFGSLTHYFFFVYAFFFVGFTCLYVMKKKNWRVCIEYGLTELLGVGTAVLLYPAMLQDFVGSRGSKTTSELVSTSSNFSGRIKSFWNIINRNVFGRTANWLLIAAAILLVVVIVMAVIRKNKGENTEKMGNYSLETFFGILTFATGLYFLFVAKCTQYKTLRYIQNICPIVLLIFFFALYYLMRKLSKNAIFTVVLYVAFILVTIFTYTRCGVDNLYEEDKEQLDIVKKYDEYPIVCVYDGTMTKQKQYYAKDSIFFLYGQKIYTADHMVGTEIFDELEEQPDAYLLFIGESYSEEARNEYVASMVENSGAHRNELLCQTSKNYVYLIEK